MKGFTLIETIIYIAIVAFLFGAGITSAFYIIDSSQKNKIDVHAEAEGNFILRKIDWALTGASEISVSGATLFVTKPALPIGQNPLVFSLNGSDMLLKRGSGTALVLNTTIAKVSGLTFVKTAGSGGLPDKVTADFSVNGKTFTITKYLRK